ncbi:YggS family pyridoxal phosphate-dependent enzyme [Rickettsiales bacterium]|nr:YggS family pyridoxal phosphate-dependent enzyme [Rickettsiales bacterium]
MMDIKEKIEFINNQIKSALGESGRADSDVQLLAVSKYHPAEKIYSAIEVGQRVFGENKVQEAFSKWPEIKNKFPDIKLHLIGPLQTNKVKEAVSLFDVIETVDRYKLVDFLAKEMNKQSREIPCYLQVNIGCEEQKSGVMPDSLKDLYDYSIKMGLKIEGLMCIPPADEDPSVYFDNLRKLAKDLGVSSLSMGMSGDFQQAIKSGSNIVRVGTAIFGSRD